MPIAHRVVDFLHDLQQLERSPKGEGILDVFERHTPFSSGALYLREGGREGAMRLASKNGRSLAPDLLDEVDAGAETGLAGAPVLVVVCGDTSAAHRSTLPSSVYPATQNLLLAANALGRDHIVAFPIAGHHLLQNLRWVLEVGVHDGDGVTGREVEAGCNRSLMAEIPRK